MTGILPPAARSVPMLGLIEGAAMGRFALQRCGGCGRFLYPVRDICQHCLSQDLGFADAPQGGTLLSETTIAITSDPWFKARPPVRQGLVASDTGVTMIAILHRDCSPEGRVTLTLRLDAGGMPIVLAFPEEGSGFDDPHLAAQTG